MEYGKKNTYGHRIACDQKRDHNPRSFRPWAYENLLDFDSIRRV
jgi:hypothetical protein